LLLASWVYGLGVRGRLGQYRMGLRARNRLPVPVISVGNIVVGGTGKTPFVIMLARELKDRGLRPAVVTRGYRGNREGKVVVVSDGATIEGGYPEFGDEAVLMAHKLPGVPVVMARDRAEGGREAIRRFGAEAILLDDGFQHLQLARDLDIVLLDRANPLGYGYLLPRGLLREPVGALRRADLIVVTGTRATEDAWHIPRGLREVWSAPVLHAVYLPTVLTDGKTGEVVAEADLRAQLVVAFSGIANPLGFERTLRSLGIAPRAHLIYPDHHPYDASDLAAIAERMAAVGATVALTTEKDAVRLAAIAPPFTVVALGVRLSLVGGQPELKHFLDALFP
jgi:tetraacyldisaccharide 4'-kinase